MSRLKTEEQRKKHREYTAAYRARKGLIKNPGVGKGGFPHSGKLHPNYKHGFYVAQTQSRQYKDKVRYCERCGEDLHDATRHKWVMHHKDHNHANHDISNLELLCKRCHQIEHKCWRAFEGSETIP